MNINRILTTVVVFVAITLWCIHLSGTQTGSLEQAREVSRLAQKHMESGQWSKAEKVLIGALGTTLPGPNAKKIRGILYFSLAYLYKKASEQYAVGNDPFASQSGSTTVNMIPSMTEHYLEKAAQFYNKALNELPGNLQVMKNYALTLRKQNKWQQAIQMLEKSAEIDGKNNYPYFIEIGDIYLENNKFQQALKFYDNAYRLNPADETAPERVIDVYRLLKPNRLKHLFPFCKQLVKINQTRLAKEGFELIINGLYRSDNTIAEDALLNWTELCTKQGWITVNDLNSLPDKNKWSSPAIKELRNVLENYKTLPLQGWWTESQIKRHVISAVMKLIGIHFVVNGKYGEAVDIYRTILDIAPESYMYSWGELSGKPVVIIDTVAELAKLYHKYPQLDPQGTHFRKLTRLLYRGKGLAYQQENLFAIQKFHTVLGLIYAERNQWTSEWAPGNAIFQLRHALDVAQKRARVEKKDFQPLPHLHRLLADGYLLVEKVNLARIEYMEAMKGYLDIDSLDNAAKTYDRLEPLLENAPDTEVQKAVALNKILLVRLSISQWSREDIEQKSKMDYENAAFFGWVKDNAFKSKQHSFINRQCFKALADAGTIAIQVGEPAAASHFYHVAYGVINKEDVLASMNDVSRLSKITSVLSESPDWGKKQVFVVTDFDLKANPSYKDGKIWSLMATEQLGCSMQVGITQTFAKEIK